MTKKADEYAISGRNLKKNVKKRYGKDYIQQTPVTVITDAGSDYICLTDMAGAKNNESRAADIIKNWLRNRCTIEFLGTWEQIHNPHFKVVKFDHFGKCSFIEHYPASITETKNATPNADTEFWKRLKKKLCICKINCLMN